MEPRLLNLADLEIVAYADRILPEQTPCVLAPIFKVKSHDTVIFPSFHIEGAHVYSGLLADSSELNHQIETEYATLLPNTLPAEPNHELWIDVDQKIRYEPWDEVEKTHLQLAKRCSEKARAVFLAEDFVEAKAQCQLAIRYHDRYFDPYIILMTIARLQNKKFAEKMYSRAVEDFLGGELCLRAVSDLLTDLTLKKMESLVRDVSNFGLLSLPAPDTTTVGSPNETIKVPYGTLQSRQIEYYGEVVWLNSKGPNSEALFTPAFVAFNSIKSDPNELANITHRPLILKSIDPNKKHETSEERRG